MSLVERSFSAMGTEIRVLIGRPLDPSLTSAESMAETVEAELIDFDHRLSRFRPDSELCAFNDDPRNEVRVSSLLRSAIHAGVWAAERTGGLVDPTLLGELERRGYADSLYGCDSPPLDAALALAPPRKPAQPNPRAAWRSILIEPESGMVRRPPGVRFDTGGTGKGLAADLVARRLAGYARYAIDCGGDVRVGGFDPNGDPIEIEVRHPLTGEAAETLKFMTGAVATSGLDARLWQSDDGRYAHHLLDPATGEPAWTGLICVTAYAPTTLEADVLAKAALLSGPIEGPVLLAQHGGLVVHDDGSVEVIGTPLPGDGGAFRA